MNAATPSFLGLDGLHVFITGAAGGIGSAAVREFLVNGCRVTAFDRRPNDESSLATTDAVDRLYIVQGDLTSEDSLSAAFDSANSKFGPVNILVANAGITDESAHPPIWEIDTKKWDAVNTTNVRGTFLTIKQFLLNAKRYQDANNVELKNLAIVITGSETGKFGQEGHAEYASGKAGLQYGLVKTVKNEIVRLNSKARINAVAPGWVNTPLIGDRLDDPREMWAECQATVALKKIAQPEDIARTMAFLASHRAAGHISGECLSVDGGQEGRLLWKESQILNTSPTPHPTSTATATPIPLPLVPPSRPRRLRICLSVDFDALSGYLGTGHTPENTLSDYSAGFLSANIGVPRLLRLFSLHAVADKLTWFIPGHSAETFTSSTAAIVATGCEIALHGYSHEGAYAMTPTQEADVLDKCIAIATTLRNGRAPVGYRAPLYQIRESTVALLQARGFLYDSSMNAHDSLPYMLPYPFPVETPHVPDYSQPASSWMHPTPLAADPRPGDAGAEKAIVEIPASWYTEDMTPLGFYPYTASSQGYVPTSAVEKMWMDRFDWLWEHESFADDKGPDNPGAGYGSIFSLLLHPESAGRAHIVGMIDRVLARLNAHKASAAHGEITFETMESVAMSWKKHRGF